MDFKSMNKTVLYLVGAGVLVVVLALCWKFLPRDEAKLVDTLPQSSIPVEVVKAQPVSAATPVSSAVLVKTPVVVPLPGASAAESTDDAAIQAQLDRDRQQQRQTKELQIKLEQTNLELEQEKAIAEINKLKKENDGQISMPSIDGSQVALPDIIVNYIGISNGVKEAILSISGTNYPVQEKSKPTDNIEVEAISDSSVTVHFSSPKNITKTFNFKTE